MKHLILTLIAIAFLFFLDRKYNSEVDRVYLYNKWIIETYCRPGPKL